MRSGVAGLEIQPSSSRGGPATACPPPQGRIRLLSGKRYLIAVLTAVSIRE